MKRFIALILCLFCSSIHSESFLVFGGETGWIGQQIVSLLKEEGHKAVCAESRLENREAIFSEIERVKPDFIINCAGITGRPNVDWCEDHKIETIRSNIIGALNLIDIAYLLDLPITNFSTGCIYEYDVNHPMGSGIGFTEEDPPNFDGSYYSKTKTQFEMLAQIYPNLLNLRLRMPISSDLHPRNFITKISRYAKVINIPNSMSILDDLLPAAIDMTLKGCRGCYNFVNPGTLSHNQILDLYQEYVDPEFTYENFTLKEQGEILKAKRSNNELDCAKLLRACPYIKNANESIIYVFQKIQKNLQEKE